MSSEKPAVFPTNIAKYSEIDSTDVPKVTVRELVTTLKILGDDVEGLARGLSWSDEDFRRTEEFFWYRCGRERHRKIAALIRLRCLIAVCRGRLLQALMARHGELGRLFLVNAAANIRLNAHLGFSPVKMSFAVVNALKELQQREDVPEVSSDRNAASRLPPVNDIASIISHNTWRPQ